jgi:hypothetical protein
VPDVCRGRPVGVSALTVGKAERAVTRPFCFAREGRPGEQALATWFFQITPSGHFHVVATGLSKVLGLAFDARGRLYALETSYSKTAVGPVPFTGRLLRILRNGEKELIDTGGSLFFPTGMTFGPDGALYVSNMGFGPPFGEILRVEVPHTDDDG